MFIEPRPVWNAGQKCEKNSAAVNFENKRELLGDDTCHERHHAGDKNHVKANSLALRLTAIVHNLEQRPLRFLFSVSLSLSLPFFFFFFAKVEEEEEGKNKLIGK